MPTSKGKLISLGFTHFWSIGTNGGDPRLLDSIGTNNITLSNGASIATSLVDGGDAADFDGDDDFGQADSVVAIGSTATWLFAVNFDTTQPETFPRIFTQIDGGGNNGFDCVLNHSSNLVTFTWRDSGASVGGVAGAAITRGQLHKVCITIDTGRASFQVRVFVDDDTNYGGVAPTTITGTETLQLCARSEAKNLACDIGPIAYAPIAFDDANVAELMDALDLPAKPPARLAGQRRVQGKRLANLNRLYY